MVASTANRVIGQESADTIVYLFRVQKRIFQGFATFLIDLAIAGLGPPEELWADSLNLWLDTLH